MSKKLDAATCDRICFLVSCGYTQRTIAMMVGVSEEQLSRAKKSNPDVERAFTVGKSITQSDMKANIHRLAVEGETDSVKLNASVKAIELSGDTVTTVETTTTTVRQDILDELHSS